MAEYTVSTTQPTTCTNGAFIISSTDDTATVSYSLQGAAATTAVVGPVTVTGLSVGTYSLKVIGVAGGVTTTFTVPIVMSSASVLSASTLSAWWWTWVIVVILVVLVIGIVAYSRSR